MDSAAAVDDDLLGRGKATAGELHAAELARRLLPIDLLIYSQNHTGDVGEVAMDESATRDCRELRKRNFTPLEISACGLTRRGKTGRTPKHQIELVLG